MDYLGPNLFLGEYERLKRENQSRRDKIEERDAELTRLRVKCQGAIQILAHIREKSFSAASDLTENDQNLRDVELEVLECRERVNYFKQLRDQYRAQAEKLQRESGLLTRPTLLQDMELVVEELMKCKLEMEQLVIKNKEFQQKLNAINHNLANWQMWIPNETISVCENEKHEGKVCKGRASLIFPKIQENFTSESESTMVAEGDK